MLCDAAVPPPPTYIGACDICDFYTSTCAPCSVSNCIVTCSNCGNGPASYDCGAAGGNCFVAYDGDEGLYGEYSGTCVSKSPPPPPIVASASPPPPVIQIPSSPPPDAANPTPPNSTPPPSDLGKSSLKNRIFVVCSEDLIMAFCPMSTHSLGCSLVSMVATL